MIEERGIDRLIRYTFFSVILCMVLLFLFNGEYSILPVITAIILTLALKNIWRNIIIDENKLLAVSTILIFLYQVYVMWSIYPSAGRWDPAAIMCGTRSYLFEGDPRLTSQNGYYSRYPNNLLMQFVSIFLVKLDMGYGLLWEIYDGMMIVAVCNCLINAIACLLVYKSAALFASQRTAIVAYVFSALLIGLSPWSSIVYSDPFCLAVPISCFYLYAKPKKGKLQQIVDYGLVVAFAVVFYYIKPQSLIVLIAIVVFELTKIKKEPRRLLALFAGAILGVGVFGGTQAFIDYECEINNIEIDPEARFGAAHFFMMGLREGNGGYSQEDVVFSGNIKDAKERREANLQESIRRIQSYGVLGIIKHLAEKMTFVYTDGTFAWGCEGGFFDYAAPFPNTKMSLILRSYYYKDSNNYHLFKGFMQTIWLSVLTFNVLSGFRKGKTKKFTVLYITILGITLYEMLFEARAHYLYIFAPIYCLIAASGVDVVNEWIEKAKEKHLTRGKAQT